MNSVQNLEPAPQFLAYNQYIYQHHNGDTETFCQGGLTVSEFMATNDMVTVANGLTEVNLRPMLISETDTTVNYRVASDISKGVCRQLILIIRQLESEGACLAALASENLRISLNGTLTLRDVQILRNMNAAALDAHLRNIYVSAADIIDGLYGSFVPEEIGHLTVLMRNHFEARAVFPIHAGLASQAKHAEVFKVVHDFIRDCLTYPEYRVILAALNPLQRHWKAKVRKNSLLNQALQHPNANYATPANQRYQQQLNQGQRLALWKIGIDPATHNSPTVIPNDMNMIECHNLLTFLRNHSAHRMEPYLEWLFYGDGDFTAEEAELVAMVRFPKILPELQWSLFNLNQQYLLDLNLEKYF